jgi:hypothetical protein
MRWAAHPLAMVLAALDGEGDPVQLGVEPDSEAWAELADAADAARKTDDVWPN